MAKHCAADLNITWQHTTVAVSEQGVDADQHVGVGWTLNITWQTICWLDTHYHMTDMYVY